jgi:hypothetical protein
MTNKKCKSRGRYTNVGHSLANWRCDCCGRFMREGSDVTWDNDCEQWVCKRCVDKHEEAEDGE